DCVRRSHLHEVTGSHPLARDGHGGAATCDVDRGHAGHFGDRHRRKFTHRNHRAAAEENTRERLLAGGDSIAHQHRVTESEKRRFGRRGARHSHTAFSEVTYPACSWAATTEARARIATPVRANLPPPYDCDLTSECDAQW